MDRNRLRLLLIGDRAEDVRCFEVLVAEINRAQDYEHSLELTVARNLALARRILEEDSPDATILDLSLGGAAGLENIRDFESHLPEAPVIALAGSHQLALEAVRIGAQDYLVKGKISADVAFRAIRYAIERHRMSAALRSAAYVDELTGLYNRRGFLQLARHQIKLSRRKGRGFSLTFVDLDGLKLINDQHGHSEGDEALKQAAEVLRASFRESDVIGRIGGDEFVSLAIETDAEDEAPIRGRLLESIRAHNARSGKPYRLSMSIGVIHQDHGVEEELGELLRRADSLMYEEKKAKRGSSFNPS